MNDEAITNPTNSTDPMGSDSLPQTDLLEKEALSTTAPDDAQADCPTCDNPEALVEIFEDSTEDPDPCDATDSSPTAEEQLEQLRNELNTLRREINERDEHLRRMSAEYEEFYHLYPDASPEAIPDCVWNDVKKGIPLAAAYALTQQRKRRTEELAAASNLENARRSFGAVSGDVSDYFSPDEVRAMSQSEVRANYQSIMRSMPKWR